MSVQFYSQPNTKNTIKNYVRDFLDRTDIEVGPPVKLAGKELNQAQSLRLVRLLFLSGIPNNKDIGNDILKRLQLNMCHFSPMMAGQILFQSRDSMDERSVAVLEEYLKSVAPEFIGHELDFVGVNDNFPLMATYTAITQFRLFGLDGFYQEAVRRLNQVQRLLKRRGALSEYNSPGYSILQLHVMAEMSQIIEDEALRKIVLSCEARVWADVMAHFHLETGRIAGPHSRSYRNVTSGNDDIFSVVLGTWFSELCAYPLCQFDVRRGTADPQIAMKYLESLYYLNTQFHCPVEIAKLGFDKQYPFTVRQDSEFSSSTDATTAEPKRSPAAEDETYEYAAGMTHLTTYMTETYGVGTATREFHNGGQTNAFWMNYKRKSQVRTPEDVGCVFSRYLINDKEEDSMEKEYFDMGRKLCFQHENKVLAVYKPKIGGNKVKYGSIPAFLEEHFKKQEISGNLGVESLKLTLFVPVRRTPILAVYLGEKKLGADLCGTAENPCSVFVDEGETYLAFHPLTLTDYGRKYAVEVRLDGMYLRISFFNYQGQKRDFARRGFLLTQNGFAAEISAPRESGNFDTFRKEQSLHQIEDYLDSSEHSRQTFVRKTCYQSGRVSLACAYSPVSEGIQYTTINDYPMPEPKLEITGFDVSALPFME